MCAINALKLGKQESQSQNSQPAQRTKDRAKEEMRKPGPTLSKTGAARIGHHAGPVESAWEHNYCFLFHKSVNNFYVGLATVGIYPVIRMFLWALSVEGTYLRDGDVLSRTSTSGLAAGTTAWPPEIISFAVICLPYKALLASSSVSIEAPSSETPANSPFDRE